MKRPRLTMVVVLAFSATLFVVAGAGIAFAANPNAGCNQTPYENTTGNGANHSGAYDDTCDGSASENGNGGGAAVGKPCAGCVGEADEKNPPGQDPDGTDANAGYECDSNSGVGQTNPAHTGCEAVDNPPEEEGNPPDEEVNRPGPQVLGRTFLATTGSPTTILAALGTIFVATGAALRFRIGKSA